MTISIAQSSSVQQLSAVAKGSTAKQNASFNSHQLTSNTEAKPLVNTSQQDGKPNPRLISKFSISTTLVSAYYFLLSLPKTVNAGSLANSTDPQTGGGLIGPDLSENPSIVPFIVGGGVAAVGVIAALGHKLYRAYKDNNTEITAANLLEHNQQPPALAQSSEDNTWHTKMYGADETKHGDFSASTHDINFKESLSEQACGFVELYLQTQEASLKELP